MANSNDECDEESSAGQVMVKEPFINGFDDIDAELYRLRVITDMLWDFATEIRHEGENDKRLLDRVCVLSTVARDMSLSLEEGFYDFHARARETGN